MANPFDQFDEAPAKGSNPFDQFDGPKKAAPKPKRSLVENVTGAMANVNRGLGIGDELAGGALTVRNLLSGRSKIDTSSVSNALGSLGGAFRQGMADQRTTEDTFAAERPNTAAVARGTGMAATMLVPGGQSTNLLSAGTRGFNTATALNAARGATTAGLTAAAYGAADRGTARERLSAASEAATNPLVLGLGAAGGVAATPGVKRVKTPKVDPDVRLLAQEGVPLTPGRMGGRVRKTAEDAGTSLPFVGDAIAARQREGFEGFNRAAVNRTLKPLGTKLPDDVPAGTEAVKYAGDLLSKGYESAIPGKVIRADPGFADELSSSLDRISTLTPDHRARLLDILDQRLTSRLPKTGEMDGRLYKQIQSELDYEASRFSASPDADQRAMGDAISAVQTAMENAARRQDPAFAAKIDALDRGWAELTRIETAAAKSTDLSGIFTPAQYAQSIRAGDAGRIRKRGVARGEALSQDLARAGVRVLPSKVPDSGTPTRAAWGMVASAPGAVLGAVTGGGVGAAAGIAGTAATLGAASRMYTPQAIEAANAALSSRISAADRADALRALAEMAARDPRAQELYRQVLARLSRAAGVAGGAQASQNMLARP